MRSGDYRLECFPNSAFSMVQEHFGSLRNANRIPGTGPDPIGIYQRGPIVAHADAGLDPQPNFTLCASLLGSKITLSNLKDWLSQLKMFGLQCLILRSSHVLPSFGTDVVFPPCATIQNPFQMAVHASPLCCGLRKGFFIILLIGSYRICSLQNAGLVHPRSVVPS